MSERRTPNPSPLAGEGASRPRSVREAGEGLDGEVLLGGRGPAGLVIDVDGGQHADSVQDRRRDRWFAANKFRVMRFWNNEVRSNLEGVMTLLSGALRVEEWP
jgi:hypothetical protein